MNGLEDQPLAKSEIRDFAAGDNVMQRKIYERYKRLVAYFIVRTVPDWTVDMQDDLAQEVWLKAFKSAKTLHAESEGELKAWLKAITHSIINDMARKRGRSPQIIDLEAIPDLPADNADTVVQIAARQSFAEFMSGLTDTERIVVEMHFIEDRSYEETAQAAGATKWQIKGVIRNLRKRALAFKRLDKIRNTQASFIAGLSPEQRRTFERHFVLGESISALARELGFSRKSMSKIAASVKDKISNLPELKKILGR